jgi:hypothetical protein
MVGRRKVCVCVSLKVPVFFGFEGLLFYAKWRSVDFPFVNTSDEMRSDQIRHI